MKKQKQTVPVINVFVCPGNAGTALENKVTNISLDANNFEVIETFCKEENIELVIIGPEQPLVHSPSSWKIVGHYCRRGNELWCFAHAKRTSIR